MKSKIPVLTPKVSEWMTELMNNPCLLAKLIEEYGSPVNIHQTQPFIENAKKYQQVFWDLGLEHRIYFARKANKCTSFIEAAAQVNLGVDTASYNELKECLDAGMEADDLVVTAAIKTEKLIRLAIKTGVLIILDNSDECQIAQKVASELQISAKIGLRVSGFEYQGNRLYSRFGFDIRQVKNFLQENFGPTRAFNQLTYTGLHFHLNGYSTGARAAALNQCLLLSQELFELGFETSFIDIGGGFLMNYLQSKEEWEHFKVKLQSALKGEIEPITYQNDGLGYKLIEGAIHGDLSTYPYFNELYQEKFLVEILNTRFGNGSNVETARSLGIELRMEPGRSLLDQAGMTVARVNFRKKDLDGNWLIGLEMNMTQMQSSSADFLLDPFLIPMEETEEKVPVEVYFTGAYCLERDVLLKRRIPLMQLPQVGDLVVFVNTAGYMMHFFESEAHLFDLAANLFYIRNSPPEENYEFLEDKGALKDPSVSNYMLAKH